MSRSIALLLTIILFDAVSMGLVLTNLPTLLSQLEDGPNTAAYFGIAMACYAGFQFLVSPVLGSLSDRTGRKPVLLVSIIGGFVDASAMAFSSSIWAIMAGRLLAGMTSGNALLISAWMADLTAEKDRARGFGWMFAAFGIGLGIGPLIGGVAAEWSPRLPFIISMLFSATGVALISLFLANTVKTDGSTASALNFNPFSPVLHALSDRRLAALFGLYLVLSCAGNLTANIWPLYGPDRFSWPPLILGASMTTLSVFTFLTQGLLLGSLDRAIGNRGVLLVGVFFDCLALFCMAFVLEGGMIFTITPIFALGGLGIPALQSLISKQAYPGEQGAVQGTLASLNSLMMTFTPIAATIVYTQTMHFPVGVVWIAGALLYIFAAPLIGAAVRSKRRPGRLDGQQ